MLSAGADPNVPDRWGATPLGFAEGKKEITALLLKYNAKQGEPVIFYSKPQPFDLNDNDERLFYAAKYNDLKTAEILYILGWHFNRLDIDGRTPAHVAAAHGNDDMVKFFAAKGADLSYFDYRGRCSMDEAEENGFIDLHIWIDSVISDNLIK